MNGPAFTKSALEGDVSAGAVGAGLSTTGAVWELRFTTDQSSTRQTRMKTQNITVLSIAEREPPFCFSFQASAYSCSLTL
jgi:hypothetical protein